MASGETTQLFVSGFLPHNKNTSEQAKKTVKNAQSLLLFLFCNAGLAGLPGGGAALRPLHQAQLRRQVPLVNDSIM